MKLREQKTLRLVLFEGEGSRSLAPENRFAVARALLEQGYAVTRATGGQISAPAASHVLVLGEFAGPAPATASPASVRVAFKDISGRSVEEVIAFTEAARQEQEAVRHGEWKPWFPVIDYDRCTNCMQCLSFCLFGVYGVDAQQKIQVQNNDSCKTNCPACSRVCPEAAIMFPKYKAGPINGDVVSDADLQREKMKIDISALLGDDVYAMLRERSARAQSRFSKERDSEKALKERQRCLTQLAQAGDIPPEVLMALPSPEEIQRKAEEAAQKAKAALEANQPKPI